jgi:hypothetical protein
VLIDSITLQNPYVVERVAHYTQALQPVISDSTQRNAQWLARLGAGATQQAGLLAYNDVFMVVFYMAWGCFAVLALHIVAPKIATKIKAGKDAGETVAA